MAPVASVNGILACAAAFASSSSPSCQQRPAAPVGAIAIGIDTAFDVTMRLIADTKYTDNTVQAGQTYSYYVTSVDGKGVESKPSDKIVATVPAGPPAK